MIFLFIKFKKIKSLHLSGIQIGSIQNNHYFDICFYVFWKYFYCFWQHVILT